MKVLIIEQDQELIRLLSINLKIYLGLDTINKNNEEDAKKVLTCLDDIELIIAPASISRAFNLNNFYTFLEKSNLNIPFISIGKNETLPESIYQLSTPLKWESLIRTAAIILDIDVSKFTNTSPTKLLPIGLEFLNDIDIVPCDIYFKVKKRFEHVKYIKRFNAGEKISNLEIEKYRQKGLKNIYIDQDLKHYFLSYITNNLSEKLNRRELSPIQKHFISSNINRILQQYLTNLKINESLVELTSTSIEHTLGLIENSESIQNEYRILYKNKLNYYYQRNHLLTLIGTTLLNKIKNVDKDEMKTFAQLVFFSDIYLKTQKEIEISTMEDLNSTELTPDQRQNVLEHAKKAAELSKKVEGVSDLIPALIRQHHGSFDGRGFPSHFPSKLPSIIKAFIISDFYVKMLLSPKYPRRNAELITILYTKFSDKEFQDIVTLLKEEVTL